MLPHQHVTYRRCTSKPHPQLLPKRHRSLTKHSDNCSRQNAASDHSSNATPSFSTPFVTCGDQRSNTPSSHNQQFASPVQPRPLLEEVPCPSEEEEEEVSLPSPSLLTPAQCIPEPDNVTPPTSPHPSEDLVMGLCPEDFSFSLHDNSITGHADLTPYGPSSGPTSHTTGDKMRGQQSYPSGTFYGLPTRVLDCLTTYRGISKLYG